jgi:putative phosphoesterase
MRVALISDIHGNVAALDAVLTELDGESFDEIVCLGDVVAGPCAAEALRCIRDLGCSVIMGNWDAWSVDGMPEAGDWVEERLYEIGAFWAQQLTEDDGAFVRSFLPTLEIALDERTSLLCFHGSPTSFDDWIVATTPDEEVARMLDGAGAPLLAGGHTHMQMVRHHDAALILNPGSVGQPFVTWSRETVRVAAAAEYAIVASDDGRLSCDLRRTSFDVDAHVRAGIESGMPHADWWAASWPRG